MVESTSRIKSNGSITTSLFLRVLLLILFTGGLFIVYETDILASPSSSKSSLITHQQQQQQQQKEDQISSSSKQHCPEDIEIKSSKPTTTTTTNHEHHHHHHHHIYKPRGRPMNIRDRQRMIERWGSWTFVDTNKENRPKYDYYKEYTNRDIPKSKFPINAWQIDKVYLSKFLNQSLNLIYRAQEAILYEYGKVNDDDDGGGGNGDGKNFTERSKMFEVTKFDTLQNVVEGLSPKDKTNRHHSLRKGGWTTKKSWEGLKRRLLHAIMTEDNFVFAMGGHSAAAGHGNHFQQSYTLQVQWILEAVFARLGVKHEARNFGNGGLGTGHNGLGASSIYGPDIDILMWDSSMTEGRDEKAIDLMHRQQLLGGVKVPFLLSLSPEIIQMFNREADVDVGFPGNAYFGIPVAQSYEEIINNMTWAMRYVKCNKELHNLCRSNEYMGTCWIHRNDFEPTTRQNKEPKGRASWHPGNRIHQVTGRVIAFTILQALKEVLTMWNDADGYDVPDESWHVTKYYNDKRKKVIAMADIGPCKEYKELDLDFACKYAMKARTEFTPRAYPSLTNMRTLMDNVMVSEINKPSDNLYNAPDVFNPNLHPPPDAIDVLSIVEAGIEFNPILNSDYYASSFYKRPSSPSLSSHHQRTTNTNSTSLLDVGRGYMLQTRDGDDFCDGTVDSFCNRGQSNDCLLYGHNDGRGGLLFHGFSGWLIFNLPDLQNGYVVIKLETWHGESIEKTKSWTSINNNNNNNNPSSSNNNNNNSTKYRHKRGLKYVPEYCENFKFEYSINGNVTTLNLDEWRGKLKNMQRIVETVTLLNDPNFTTTTTTTTTTGRGEEEEEEEKEVEVAIRIRGCGKHKVFKISHIYWS